MGERTTALAGELADGVIVTDMSADRLREAMQHVRAGRTTAGRDGTGDVVVFLAVKGELDASAVATRVEDMASVGATHVVLHVLDGRVALEDAARFVAHDLRPLVG